MAALHVGRHVWDDSYTIPHTPLTTSQTVWQHQWLSRFLLVRRSARQIRRQTREVTPANCIHFSPLQECGPRLAPQSLPVTLRGCRLFEEVCSQRGMRVSPACTQGAQLRPYTEMADIEILGRKKKRKMCQEVVQILPPTFPELRPKTFWSSSFCFIFLCVYSPVLFLSFIYSSDTNDFPSYQTSWGSLSSSQKSCRQGSMKAADKPFWECWEWEKITKRKEVPALEVWHRAVSTMHGATFLVAPELETCWHILILAS